MQARYVIAPFPARKRVQGRLGMPHSRTRAVENMRVLHLRADAGAQTQSPHAATARVSSR